MIGRRIGKCPGAKQRASNFARPPVAAASREALGSETTLARASVGAMVRPVRVDVAPVEPAAAPTNLPSGHVCKDMF